MEIVCLGELIADLLPSGVSEARYPLYELNPGGAPANVAAAISVFGGSATFIGKIGGDSVGILLKKLLNRTGTDTRWVVSDAGEETALTMVSLNENGERSFRFFGSSPADLHLSLEELRAEAFNDCKLFHFGARSLSTTCTKEATLQAVKLARRQGATISFDPNLRPQLWKKVDDARRDSLLGIEVADWIKLSLDEVKWLWDTDDIATVLLSMRQKSKDCVVTDGANGAWVLDEERIIHMPAYHVRTVDTTGAGDAFWAAWLYISLYQARICVEERLRLSSAAGALTTTKKGAIQALPSWNDVMGLVYGGIKE